MNKYYKKKVINGSAWLRLDGYKGQNLKYPRKQSNALLKYSRENHRNLKKKNSNYITGVIREALIAELPKDFLPTMIGRQAYR